MEQGEVVVGVGVVSEREVVVVWMVGGVQQQQAVDSESIESRYDRMCNRTLSGRDRNGSQSRGWLLVK
jgi:hypothetical protein